MSAKPTTVDNRGLIDALGELLAPERVITDDDSLSLYAQDIFTRSLPAMAVIQPQNTDELAAAVATTSKAGHAIIPRGGGMSYTSGYVPVEPGSVVVDMRGMNRIVEINTDDMFVTVECGCTWKDLYEALSARGVRTPFWGPLSGIHATVGGAISQNSNFRGSGKYGSAADTVIGLEVVLANGEILRTGANGRENSSPF